MGKLSQKSQYSRSEQFTELRLRPIILLASAPSCHPTFPTILSSLPHIASHTEIELMIPCSIRADVSIDVAETEDKVMRLSKAKWTDPSLSVPFMQR